MNMNAMCHVSQGGGGSGTPSLHSLAGHKVSRTAEQIHHLNRPEFHTSTQSLNVKAHYLILTCGFRKSQSPLKCLSYSSFICCILVQVNDCYCISSC